MAQRKVKAQVQTPPNGHNVDNASLAEVIAPEQDTQSGKSTPQIPPRKPLSAIKVAKPTLTEERPPSAKIYQGAPDGKKFFRVLFVDGLSYHRGFDAAGMPIVEFEEYHILQYEGVNFLVALDPDDLQALRQLTTLKRRWHIPCVTEDDVCTVWIMAVPFQRRGTSTRFKKDDARERAQTQILASMRDNHCTAVRATYEWIRREFDDTDVDQQYRVIPAEGKRWQTRDPVNPGFDAETWVYGCYGNNVITSLDHDVIKALRGLLDEEEASV
jgi:hypothetical protein